MVVMPASDGLTQILNVQELPGLQALLKSVASVLSWFAAVVLPSVWAVWATFCRFVAICCVSCWYCAKSDC